MLEKSQQATACSTWVAQAFACVFACLAIPAQAASSWQAIFEAVGLHLDPARIIVVNRGEAPPSGWLPRVESGSYMILEGESETALSLGFRAIGREIRVASVEDSHGPKLDIVWKEPQVLPLFDVPKGAEVFARERGSRAPLVAGFRRGAGGVLWVALSPGERGSERFPFLLHALADLGLAPPFRSNRLWAFFDSSYRSRADTAFLADRWVRGGIRGLHVAAWHYMESDDQRDAYLSSLLEECHRRGILVYAWLELPHVSEKFWRDHPEWREKTALLQDAHLDWRKLMNLANPECAAEIARLVKQLLSRFDWDGINLAELYFESLQGHENPSRFTPMNEQVRKEFQQRHGFDPVELFNASSPLRRELNAAGLRQFLEYRAALAGRIQCDWVEVLESARRQKPDLDIVLTHIDDQYDSRMRDSLGADAASALSLLERHDLTFLVEDPATVWDQGPERYAEISGKYARLTSHREKLAIDLNIVERYQDVYPTKQQVGTELFQLVNQAARAFPRVALYFENSILPADLPWLSSAAAAVKSWEVSGRRHVVDSVYGVGLYWKGPALVDGRLWPAGNGETLWLPPGRHVVEPGAGDPILRLLDFNAELISASSLPDGLEFRYRSSGRAFALVSARPNSAHVDRMAAELKATGYPPEVLIQLPRGEHGVILKRSAD